MKYVLTVFSRISSPDLLNRVLDKIDLIDVKHCLLGWPKGEVLQIALNEEEGGCQVVIRVSVFLLGKKHLEEVRSQIEKKVKDICAKTFSF